jgi:branched-chain amino acid transport system substrate-binding protein
MNKRYVAAIALLASISLTACESPTSTGASAQPSSGQAQGVTKTQVLVGTSGPLTGPVAPYGAIAEGANAYFNYINAKGGVNGRKIKLIALDDQYLPEKAAANAKQLVADKVFATVGTLGTACNEAMDPILQKAGIPITGIAAGASVLSYPAVQGRYAYPPTYTMEAHAVLKWAATNNHVKTLGVFYQNDDFGKEELTALKAAAKAQGVKIVAEIPYNATDTDYSTYALNMKAKNPDAVFEAAVPGPAAQFMKGIAELGWHPQQYLSFTSADPSMFKLAGSAINNVYVTFWQPQMNSPKAKAFLSEFQKDYPNQSATLMGLEGWAEAQIFAHALELCGSNLTWANFNNQMNSISNWADADSAAPISYSAKDHVGIHSLYIVQADSKTKTFKQVSGMLTYDQTSLDSSK